jgi:hypothetical protein
MSDLQYALDRMSTALDASRLSGATADEDARCMSIIRAHVEAQEAEVARLRAALKTCVWALRQPLDGWKGECERKALDKARDALKEQR